MDKHNPTTFPAAMLDYFGKKPGGDTQSFMQELKALNPQDREEFKDMLREAGYKLA